jgi:hypothetical protein
MDEDLRSAAISAAELATASDPANMTADRVIALTGGHGMVTMSVYTAANAIAEEVLRGADIGLRNDNVRDLPVETVLGKAIGAAKLAGADGANAALVAACCLYLAGTKAQVGIPAGNRKLGATARMLAGVDRGGVAIIPTAKMNNKISGFPAVQAIYQAMAEGRLSPVDGRRLPLFVGGGPVYGHSALGEDVVWPAMAANGARIGTRAMLQAMAGASMPPHPFTAAILGAAAILEIIHPDAEIAEDLGDYGKANTAGLVGQTAAEEAGLPPTLRVRVTGEEIATGRMIGDLGLILKDVGAPSVIGMMALDEIFSIFHEGIAGFSGGPLNPPLGHVAAYAVIAMKALIESGGDLRKVAADVMEDKLSFTFDPETSLVSLNVMARKGHEIKRGPVTAALIAATEPGKAKAIHDKATAASRRLSEGASLAEIVKGLEDERLARCEGNAGAILGSLFGAPVSVKVLAVRGGARRKSRLAHKFMAFDPLFDFKVSVGDKTAEIRSFVNEVVPEYCQGGREELAWAMVPCAAVCCELSLASCNILNVVVPAAVAAAMGLAKPAEAAEEAVSAAYITAAIPGVKAPAERVAELAVSIASFGRRG